MPALTVVAPATPSAIARLVDEYLASCRARGLSPKTVNEGYGYPLRSVLLPFLAEEAIAEPAGINARLLDRLTSRLLQDGGKRGPLSKHSVDSYCRAINHFLVWAHKEGEVAAVKAQKPKLPRRLVDVLNREEIRSMEDAAQTERDKLIIRLLADTGIRLGELVGLKTSDLIDQGRHGGSFILVRGKGARDRHVPVPRLFPRLLRYANRGRPRSAMSERLFLSSRRRSGGDYEPLSASGVHQLVRNVAQLASINKRVYPHLLRHSYATFALQQGMNPIQLAKVLGHSSLSMIQNVYAHLTPEDSYEAVARMLTAEADEGGRR